MADLTTLAAVKRQLGLNEYIDGTLTTNTDDDDLITDYVTQASVLFEQTAQRELNFTFVAAPGTLTLDACPPHAYGRKLFFLTPVTGVYEVINGDGHTLTSDEYRLLPANNTPYYAIEFKRNAGRFWTYTTNPEGAITVAGTLGYCAAASIPEDVKLAVTKLAANLYQNRDNKGEVIRFADGSTQVPDKPPDMIFKVLQRYQKVRVYS